MSKHTNRVAARYIKRAASEDRKQFDMGVKAIGTSLLRMKDVVFLWTGRGTPPPGHGAEGYESLADVYGPVQHVVNKIEDLEKAYISLKRVRVASKRMDPKFKRAVIPLFKRAGLDGNGRFRKPQHGYSKALDILAKFEIELDDVVSSHLFNGDSGTIRADLAYSNSEDPFSPESISNSVLVISFTKMAKDSYEVLAYLS